MRTWLPTLLLLLAAACDPDSPTDETDPGTDTDVDTDSDSDSDSEGTPDIELSVDALERTVLAPGESVTVGIRLVNAPPDVDVDATPDDTDCVTTDITGLDGDQPQLTITGGTTFLGDCVLTVQASGPGTDPVRVSLPIRVDVDWEGEVHQWGEGGICRLGSLLSHRGQLLAATSLERVDTPALSLERRDAWSDLVETASVEGAPWEGGVFAVAARGDQAWLGVYDLTDQAFVLPVDGGTMGLQWPVPVGGRTFPTAMGVEDDQVWMVGMHRHDDGRRGVVFATWSPDGTNPVFRTWFAPNGNVLAPAVVRTDTGWRIGGLAYGTPFPEVEDDVEWGSWLGDFDEEGTLVSVQRLGTDNSQIRHLEVLDDGRTLIGGFVRNVDLDGNSTSTGYDAFLRLLEADGSVAWTTIVATELDQRINTFRVLDDTIVAGGIQEASGWALGADLDTGTVQWEKTWGSDGTDIATSAIHGHGVVLGGSTSDALAGELTGTVDRWMVRLGADGTLR